MSWLSRGVSLEPRAVRPGAGSGLAPLGWLGGLLGAALTLLLALPLLALAVSASVDDLARGMSHPSFSPALWLSLRTTIVSLAIIVATGTPLAWWLSTSSSSPLARAVGACVDLPLVIPPAVVGIALLMTFGRQGLLGGALERLGMSLPFTEKAVVLSQVVVSAPFFVRAASSALGEIDPDVLIVARTLGASRQAAFFRVVVPVALPGLAAGASLAWARSLGELGATMLFAGNGVGVTQTMPLAIFTALESDVQLSVVFSLVLAAMGAALLVALRSLLSVARARADEARQEPR